MPYHELHLILFFVVLMFLSIIISLWFRDKLRYIFAGRPGYLGLIGPCWDDNGSISLHPRRTRDRLVYKEKTCEWRLRWVWNVFARIPVIVVPPVTLVLYFYYFI